MKRFTGFVFLMTMTLAGLARAGDPPLFDNVRVSPNPAQSGQPVVLFARWGGCGANGATTTSVVGTTITVTQGTGEQVCGVPPPPSDVAYPLGTFAPGNYRARYIVDPGTAQQQVTDVPFVVTGAGNAEGLPVNSSLALAGLALALLLLVRRALQCRTSPQ